MDAVLDQDSTLNHLKAAVHRNHPFSRSGLLERGFTLAFRKLVYSQIWEDPLIDMEALAIRPSDHIVTIASGGCNVLSYLIADPAKITAIDLNGAHVALNRLKLTAAQTVPDYETFRRFFADGRRKENIVFYDESLKHKLDAASRAYWDKRALSGRRRIGMFARNPYKYGLLGRFISMGHLVARLHGVDLRIMLTSQNHSDQQVLFDRYIAPLFDQPLIRWLTRQPASLYGLGIPPAQFDALAGGPPEQMAGVLRERLRRLACDFDLRSNYFARQAFGRSYDGGPDAALPPYLEGENFESVRSRASRVQVKHASLIDVFRDLEPSTVDCVVLLDAQDWMSGSEIQALWTEITRVGRPDARVIFRTAGVESVLPGSLSPDLMRRWSYDSDYCGDLTKRDRSSIYGGFHLYRLHEKP